MAEQNVSTNAAEGKDLGISWDNSEQAKWECTSAMGQLAFLIRMLDPQDDEDVDDLTLRFYERRGLASLLRSTERHLQAVWSEVLGPLSSYIGEQGGGS
jgi:hypothetical protein